jgi:hypothetical protein
MTQKSVIFLERTPRFSAKAGVFLKRNLQVALVVMVKNEARVPAVRSRVVKASKYSSNDGTALFWGAHAPRV